MPSGNLDHSHATAAAHAAMSAAMSEEQQRHVLSKLPMILAAAVQNNQGTLLL